MLYIKLKIIARARDSGGKLKIPNFWKVVDNPYLVQEKTTDSEVKLENHSTTIRVTLKTPYLNRLQEKNHKEKDVHITTPGILLY